jgi:hypothetical protein
VVDITSTLNLPNSLTHTTRVSYVLYLPHGIRWVFDDLEEGAYPTVFSRGAFFHDAQRIYIPVDLLTAARLGLIKRGDDSGIGEEQWAWMNLIGLTGDK